MKLHAQMYLVAAVGIVLSMANGQLVDNGAHLLITSPWDSIIKLSSLLAIAGWFVEALDIWHNEHNTKDKS